MVDNRAGDDRDAEVAPNSVDRCTKMREACRVLGVDFDPAHPPPYLACAAPMVSVSDLPFRMLCRNHSDKGIPVVAWTWMLNSVHAAVSPGYVSSMFDTVEEDRPLVVQFAACDAEQFTDAAVRVQEHCDAVEVNLGCPQSVASQGGYGAFLLDTPESRALAASIVARGAALLRVPVLAKIRMLPSGVDDTIAFCQLLERSGCALITVHGRNRFQKGRAQQQCVPDYAGVEAIARAVSVPVIVNGGVLSYGDIAEVRARCPSAVGVMSAHGLRENPAMFECQYRGQVSGAASLVLPDGGALEPNLTPLLRCTLALEYMQLADSLASGRERLTQARRHLFCWLNDVIHDFVDLRKRLANARHFDEMYDIARLVRDRLIEKEGEVDNSNM